MNTFAIGWITGPSTVAVRTWQFSGGHCDWSITSDAVSDFIPPFTDPACIPHAPPYKYIMSPSEATGSRRFPKGKPSTQQPECESNHTGLLEAHPDFIGGQCTAIVAGNEFAYRCGKIYSIASRHDSLIQTNSDITQGITSGYITSTFNTYIVLNKRTDKRWIIFPWKRSPRNHRNITSLTTERLKLILHREELNPA